MSLDSTALRLNSSLQPTTLGARPLGKPRILVVEDGPSEREALVRVLQFEGYEVPSARDPESAMRFIDQPIDVVISDLRMGKQSGIDLLQRWRDRRPTTPFILVTAYGEIESAVTAMKLGARDYITKPIDPTRLLNVVQTCLAEPSSSQRRVSERFAVESLLGDSPAIRRVREQIDLAAAAVGPVLICGEAGTGKEFVARAVHARSARAAGPFVVMQATAATVVDTDADWFGGASARGGTLFIDEIGELSPAAQAGLEGAIDKGNTDVRWIAASKLSLRQSMQDGAFRAGLYHRLSDASIFLPPLRERREDLSQWIEHFVRSVAVALEKPIPSVAADLFSVLLHYDWPGNVRELRNCIESMIVLSDGEELQLAHLPTRIAAVASSETSALAAAEDSRLDSLEKSVILQALRRFDGNRTRTAHELGISVRTLQRRLKSWGITAPD